MYAILIQLARIFFCFLVDKYKIFDHFLLFQNVLLFVGLSHNDTVHVSDLYDYLQKDL